MRPTQFTRSILTFAALATLSAHAADHYRRSILLSEHPENGTHSVYVKGQVITTLRFEQPVNPSKTKMLGWEGRLEPLTVVHNKVILEPIRDLHRDDGLPLIVTLTDGTEVPFLVRPPWPRRDNDWAPILDQQVDVFKNRESHASMHAALVDALAKNDALMEENERYRKEETSEDHALAALLASGAVAQTPFTIFDHVSGKDADAAVDATIFKGKGKAAVVFKVKNLATEKSWSVKRVRLVTVNGGHDRAVAVRATVREVMPGGSGVLAVVADGAAFVDDGELTSLWLELYQHDGLRQAFVQLAPTLIAR
ncbi:DUF2381 family protein [Myxococcus xanthus]|uniref:DUF2381 family protein n=1 Tax=Myxococcus xanthus TaxID=34 RepID=UPI001129328C|nr:DUF2381 family protein [Myxococcus xanthus]QDE84013.1 hypothetical protein BHS07_21995 [Myxococcus xanthus]QDF05874.1 hypothetical protein BHS04_22085 [Myxococcus xanthus]